MAVAVIEKLNAIEERAKAATEGPWEAHYDSYSSEGIDYKGGYIPNVCEEFNDGDGYHAPLSEEDADFMAHSREDVPLLSGALKAVLDLHRPRIVRNYLGSRTDCDYCTPEYGMETVAYPCPTVAAIESAMKGN